MPSAIADPRRLGDPSSAPTVPLQLLAPILEWIREPGLLIDLSLVCREWKDIILGTPSLWAHVDINYKTTLAQLQFQLQHSKSAKLSVDIFRPHSPYAEPQCLPTVLKEFWRIERLSLIYDFMPVESAFVETIGSGLTWPCLRILVVSNSTMDGMHDAQLDIVAPQLAQVHLHGRAYIRDWNILELGVPLKRIKLDKHASACTTGLFVALLKCPNLEELVFDNLDVPNAVRPHLPLDDIKRLPQMQWLVRLQVSLLRFGVVELCGLLSVCPALERLRIDVKKLDGRGAGRNAMHLARVRELIIRCQAYDAECDPLTILLPYLDMSKLVSLGVKGIPLPSQPLLSLPALQTVYLDYVECGLDAIVHLLSSCRSLRHIALAGVVLTPADNPGLPLGVIPPLPDLQTAILQRDPGSRIVDLFMSLLPQGIKSVQIGVGTVLADDHLSHLLSELHSPDLLLHIHDHWHNSIDVIGPLLARSWDSPSISNSIEFLNTQTTVLSRITTLVVDMELSVEVFGRPLCLPNLDMLTFDQPGGNCHETRLCPMLYSYRYG
ncbi:hypothetical protein EXIGLDRAFT_695763 [Exidia glandulosa HHB12029]|uniref:F-box domain-containing protein n=1 Tax=Exidia glandulosa HHB12029 TaxID=1314781 RepID=A0A165FM17_EXIGL|nr:hypothetical protein EXIGLDRAFT_695763 [Exidia glandulosa HHB12029]